MAKKYLNIPIVDACDNSATSSDSIIDDTVSQFDLIMDELVDSRISSRIQNESDENDDNQFCELVLYIQKNSRLKLILLSDATIAAANELKFENIIKIVS